MTDYRALCAELVETLSRYQERLEETYDPDSAEAKELDAGFRVLERARATLAEPEPPVDGEVAELVLWLRLTADLEPRLSHVGYGRLARAADLLERLAVPEQVGPTDEELTCAAEEAGFCYESNGHIFNSRYEGYDIKPEVLSFARAVLARWGRP